MVRDILEDYVFAGPRGEVVDGLKDLVGHTVPFQRRVKRQCGVAAKSGGDAIAVEWNRCQSSRVDALGKLSNATLSLEPMHHIKDGAAVGLLSVSLVEFGEREKRRGLARVR